MYEQVVNLGSFIRSRKWQNVSLIQRSLPLLTTAYGVTKTTTSINLADHLAQLNGSNNVVLIDIDPQANASKHIGPEHPAKVTHNLAELLLNPSASLNAFIFETTQIEGVSLIYGSLSLETVPDIIKQEDPRPNEVLKARIAPLMGVADYIILDCPPNLGLLTAESFK